MNGFHIDTDGYHWLNVPNSTMTVAPGIDPQGHIVAVYNNASGTPGVVTREP
jgi:hypothetical protein